jgi:signal transduction histidine kinase
VKLFGAHSIRRKLNFILIITTTLALVLAGLGLMVFDQRSQRQALEHDLLTQADIIGMSSSAALAFDDAKVGAENLSVLQARPNVTAAALFNSHGGVFATFQPKDRKGKDIPALSTTPMAGIDGDWEEVWRPITSNGERVGTIYLQMRHGLVARLATYLGVLFMILTSSLAAALLLSHRLQTVLLQPVMSVSNVARQILKERDFSLRAEKTSEDEIGALVDAFNAMLDELGLRAATLERANRALRDSERAKDEFLATLAHELRNPLAPIRTGLEILRMDRSNGPASARARATMDRQLTHMIRLIDDLLDISRINSGKIRLALSRASLSSIVDTALDISRPMMESRHHHLHVELPAHDIELMGDPTRLAQSLGNLLNNAAKYTHNGGEIVLSAHQEGVTAVVAVTDNGVGIPADMLESVFMLFTQVGRTLDSSQGGLGIGLYLVKSLVELHGGKVTAASGGPSQGSTFTVELPALPQRQEAPQGSDGKRAAACVQPLRILIVDDNVDAAETLATVLEMEGHAIQTTYTGESVLDAAGGFNPDIVLLDIGLPGISGYDVARQLRAQRRFDNTRLVALTGWGAETDRLRSRDAGFDAHLTKPVDFEELQNLLQHNAS